MKLDHLKLIEKFEFSNSYALWTIKLSLNLFSKLIEAKLDHTCKRESVPHNLFCKCANLQKIHVLKKYLFQGSKQSSMNPFSDLAEFSEMA
jgi:hypothetical protein